MQAEGTESLKEALDRHYEQMYAGADNSAADSTSLVSFKPLKSVALQVHPHQIPEAIADAKKKGVPVDFTPRGRPIFTSSKQFREYCRVYGYRHRGY